jgi:hypothetical protein
MARPGLVDQQGLLRWANTYSARSDFPRLIRRLILETGTGVAQLGFPAGEGVSAGSWDGTVRSTKGTAFIPLGLSFWELSVEESVGRKAEADYRKRTPLKEAAYVAAILRRWRKRKEWADGHAAEGKWKDVRAYGVDDIETWLESAPVTHAWISEQLGYEPHGLVTADTWWEGWSQATTPVIPFGLVLAGDLRAKTVEDLKMRLARPAQIITVKATSTDEALAFVAAVAHQEQSSDGGELLARTAFVDGVASWRALRDHKSPLVLVARSDEVRADIAATTGFAHHVIIPVTASSKADIELPPIDAALAAGVLRDAGLDDRRAGEVGQLARRSLLTMQRRLANKPELHEPAWAKPPVQRVIRRLLLATQWNEQSAADHEIVAHLVGEQYDTLREELASLAAQADPLIEKVDRSWSLISPFDAWLLLVGQLREDDLQRLEPAVRNVLLEIDPALELDREERWIAALRGKVRKYSGDIRHGLATSVALLGARGHKLELGGGSTGAALARYLVKFVLEQANQDSSCQLWASLADVLPLLAEAAPDAFLNAVRGGVKGDTPLLKGMFTDAATTSLSASSPHSALLWAMEGVAWSPQHFGQVIDLLARLAEIDPGGKLASRPQSSLDAIFCPWHPENSVSVDRRLAVIDGLRRNHPAISWLLMIDLLPELQATHFPTHEPEYRDWKPLRVPVTLQEYWTFIDGIISRLIEDADASADRWQQIIGKLSHLPPPKREEVSQALSALVGQDGLPPDSKALIWKALRDLVAKHREFPDADWSLPAEELDRLSILVERLAPLEAEPRHEWLFNDWHPELGDYPRRGNLESYMRVLAERRAQAVAEIEATGGLDAIKALAHNVTLAWAVGMATADAGITKYESDFLVLLESEDHVDIELGVNYIERRFRQAGWPWVESLISEESILSATQRGIILVRTLDFPKAWDIADAQGEEVAKVFWNHFPRIGLGEDVPYLADAARRLLSFGRSVASLDLISIYLGSAQADNAEIAELVAAGLEGIIAAGSLDPELPVALQQYDFQRFFALLQQHKSEVGWERIARLEWLFLPLLGFDAQPPTLHQLMATDPGFFVDVIKAVYRPHSRDETPELSREQEQMATNGYRLLSNWSMVPGVSSDGVLDGIELRRWIAEALRLLLQADRLVLGEQHIGKVLESSPRDSDGTWPGVEVRNLLEELQNEQIENGMAIAILNRRGFTSRSPGEGGRQEWDLVEDYRRQADQFADQWPRIASVLRVVASDYESQARREDAAAERFRRGLER